MPCLLSLKSEGDFNTLIMTAKEFQLYQTVDTLSPYSFIHTYFDKTIAVQQSQYFDKTRAHRLFLILYPSHNLAQDFDRLYLRLLNEKTSLDSCTDFVRKPWINLETFRNLKTTSELDGSQLNRRVRWLNANNARMTLELGGPKNS